MKSRGVELIAAERRRQIEVEGWTAEHDAQHKGGELSLAAAVYAVPNHLRGILMVLWPWDSFWYKPKDRIRDLVRAGALIAAEIDRLLAQEGGADGATD